MKALARRLWRLVVDDPRLAMHCLGSVAVCFVLRRIGVQAEAVGLLLLALLAAALRAAVR